MRNHEIKRKGMHCNVFTDCTPAAEWAGCGGTDPTVNPANYVLKDGDTMTGELILVNNPTSPGAALRKDEIDNLILQADTSVKDKGDGTYVVFNDYQGTGILIDTRARSNPFDPKLSLLVSSNVEDALFEINSKLVLDLSDLEDVNFPTTLVKGDILLYGTDKWENEPLDGLLGSLTFVANQPGHGFTSTNRGAPVVIINNLWDFAIATNLDYAHRAIFVEVVDTNNIRLQTGGIITDINPSITGGDMTVSTVYRLSANNSGMVTNDTLNPGDIQDDVFYAMSSNSATIVPTTPYDILDPTDPTNPLPSFGATGEALVKASNTSYDVEWAMIDSTIPLGGFTEQVLTKKTDADFDTEWLTPTVNTTKVPIGGSTSQVLSKIDGVDYNSEWTDLPPETTKVPIGGSTSQVLSKIDNADYNSEWTDLPPDTTEVPIGGIAEQVLTKIDSADYNTEWVTPVSGVSNVPPGGDTNQVLSKINSSDYSMHWSDLPTLDLNDLTDVDTAPENNQLLMFDSGGWNSSNIIKNPMLKGYEEDVDVNNLGTFNLTLANFFECTPTGDITITPVLDDGFSPPTMELQTVSCTIHLDNTGGHTITMPTGTEWVGGAPTLGTKCAMTLYTLNGGVDWFAVYIGDLV